MFMSPTQPTGIGRLSIPALVLVHIFSIALGAITFAILGAVIAAILQKTNDGKDFIVGLSFLIGAVLPSVLLWRARRRSLGAHLVSNVDVQRNRGPVSGQTKGQPGIATGRFWGAVAATTICVAIGAYALFGSGGSGDTDTQKNTKIDIRGVYPGMTIDEATRLANQNNWRCGKGAGMSDPNTNQLCDMPGGSLTITYGATTRVIYRVWFYFTAGGGAASVITDLNSQYGVKLNEESNALLSMGGGSKFVASLADGIKLQLITTAMTNDYGLSVLSDRLIDAEVKARQEKDKQARPTPKL
jgi:hypothetical protein